MRQTLNFKGQLCLFSLCLVLLCSSVSFAWQHSTDCIEGNGKTATVQRTLHNYTKVAVLGAYTLKITSGIELKCTLRGDSNLLKHVITSVVDSQLQINSDSSLCMKQPLEVELQVPNLLSIHAEGVHEITIKNLHEKSFSMVLDGANIAAVDGKIEEFKLNIKGTSTLDAQRLVAQSVEVNAEGTTSAMIQVTDKLAVTASGIAEVLYVGKPTSISSNLSGLAEIAPLK